MLKFNFCYLMTPFLPAVGRLRQAWRDASSGNRRHHAGSCALYIMRANVVSATVLEVCTPCYGSICGNVADAGSGPCTGMPTHLRCAEQLGTANTKKRCDTAWRLAGQASILNGTTSVSGELHESTSQPAKPRPRYTLQVAFLQQLLYVHTIRSEPEQQREHRAVPRAVHNHRRHQVAAAAVDSTQPAA